MLCWVWLCWFSCLFYWGLVSCCFFPCSGCNLACNSHDTRPRRLVHNLHTQRLHSCKKKLALASPLLWALAQATTSLSEATQPGHGRKSPTQPRRFGQPWLAPLCPLGPGCIAVAKVSFLGSSSARLPRTILTAEAHLFFSGLPKATNLPAPLPTMQPGILPDLSENNSPDMAANRSRNLGNHRGQGVSLAKVAFLGGSRAGLPRTVPVVEACFFFFLGFQRQRPPSNPPRRLWPQTCNTAWAFCPACPRPAAQAWPQTGPRSLGNLQGQGVSLWPRCRFWVSPGLGCHVRC